MFELEPGELPVPAKAGRRSTNLKVHKRENFLGSDFKYSPVS